jgi:hypothetical protein
MPARLHKTAELKKSFGCGKNDTNTGVIPRRREAVAIRRHQVTIFAAKEWFSGCAANYIIVM